MKIRGWGGYYVFKSIYTRNEWVQLPKDQPRVVKEDPCKWSRHFLGSVHPRKGIERACVDHQGVDAIRQLKFIQFI